MAAITGNFLSGYRFLEFGKPGLALIGQAQLKEQTQEIETPGTVITKKQPLEETFNRLFATQPKTRQEVEKFINDVSTFSDELSKNPEILNKLKKSSEFKLSLLLGQAGNGYKSALQANTDFEFNLIVSRLNKDRANILVLEKLRVK